MDTLLKEFTLRKPEIVFEWSDRETEAKGWVVINSLRGGAAGGGTRMRQGLDRREVESLAKIMEIKFTVSGPPIGGAKSGINFNPHDPRKNEVLGRWFKAVTPLLKHYYGTGGDLNVDEVHDVIPITEDYGLWHPQEGIVNGHFNPRENEKIHLIGQLRQGVSKKLEDPSYSPNTNQKHLVADMITGYGVAESVRHFYKIYKNKKVEGKRVIIQGWGNVAGAAGYYLAQVGAKIVGIIDRKGGFIKPEGMSFEEVHELFVSRKNNQLTLKRMVPFDEANEQIFNTETDIFIPGAASRLVSKENIKSLINHGLELVSCGANMPFIEDDLFFGVTTDFTDHHVSLIPDFIANCGMARVFAHLMEKEIEITDENIFMDVSRTIHRALYNGFYENGSLIGIARTSLELALNKLVKEEQPV